MQYFNNGTNGNGNPNGNGTSGNGNASSGANMNPNYMTMGLPPAFLVDQQGNGNGTGTNTNASNSNGVNGSMNNYSSRVSPTVGNLLGGGGTPNKQSQLLSSIPNMNTLQLPGNAQYSQSQGRNTGNVGLNGNFSSNPAGNASTGSMSSLAPSSMNQGMNTSIPGGNGSDGTAHGNYSQSMSYRSGNPSSNNSLASLNNNGSMLLPQFVQGNGNGNGTGTGTGNMPGGQPDLYGMNQNGQYLQGGVSPSTDATNPNNPNNIIPLIPSNGNGSGNNNPSNPNTNANQNQIRPGSQGQGSRDVNGVNSKGVPGNNGLQINLMVGVVHRESQATDRMVLVLSLVVLLTRSVL